MVAHSMAVGVLEGTSSPGDEGGHLRSTRCVAWATLDHAPLHHGNADKEEEAGDGRCADAGLPGKGVNRDETERKQAPPEENFAEVVWVSGPGP